MCGSAQLTASSPLSLLDACILSARLCSSPAYRLSETVAGHLALPSTHNTVCMLKLVLQRMRVPLVSLRAFNPVAAPLGSGAGGGSGSGWRGYARARGRAARLVAARRGNLFLDPSSQPVDDSLAVRSGAARLCSTHPLVHPLISSCHLLLQGLYDSSRFNTDDRDEEDHLPGPPAAADAQGSTAGAELEDGQVVPLPQPRQTRVRTAEFVKSSVAVGQCPPARFPEFAIIGRSNVGKSSLINMLTGRTSLAMVSKTPGLWRWGGPGPACLPRAAELRRWRTLECHRPPCLPACLPPRLCRQDALHQPLHHQWLLVPGGPPGLWVGGLPWAASTWCRALLLHPDLWPSRPVDACGPPTVPAHKPKTKPAPLSPGVCRYARASKDSVVSWNTFTREYFLERETLVSVLLLVDASIPPMPVDIACAEWFAGAEVRGGVWRVETRLCIHA